MADSSDVVDRADSLMRRRRSFVAAPPASQPAHIVETPRIVEEDDIPVLTEVVSAEAAVCCAFSRILCDFPSALGSDSWLLMTFSA